MKTATDSLTLRAKAEQIANLAASQAPTLGRPSVMEDDDKVNVLLAALTEGNYRETACKLAGISKQTFYNWQKRAESGEARAVLLFDAIEKAEALAENDMVQNVRNAGKLPQFWAANMTYLERKLPDRWGKRNDDGNAPKVIVQIGVKDGDVQVNTFACSSQSLSPSLSEDIHRLSADESDASVR